MCDRRSLPARLLDDTQVVGRTGGRARCRWPFLTTGSLLMPSIFQTAQAGEILKIAFTWRTDVAGQEDIVQFCI